MMKKAVLLVFTVLFALSASGCYIYSKEPPPAPVIIIPSDSAPSELPPQPEPSGAVGPPRY